MGTSQLVWYGTWAFLPGSSSNRSQFTNRSEGGVFRSRTLVEGRGTTHQRMSLLTAVAFSLLKPAHPRSSPGKLLVSHLFFRLAFLKHLQNAVYPEAEPTLTCCKLYIADRYHHEQIIINTPFPSDTICTLYYFAGSECLNEHAIHKLPLPPPSEKLYPDLRLTAINL